MHGIITFEIRNPFVALNYCFVQPDWKNNNLFMDGLKAPFISIVKSDKNSFKKREKTQK